MAQLYILADNGQDPLAARNSGADASICGGCAFRWANGGGCYVNLGQAPLAIWRKLQRGGYPQIIGAHDRRSILGPLLAGAELRLGAYGDPAALPLPLLEGLVGLADSHTGYSHQLLTMADRARAERLAKLCMVSCETPAQALEADRRGWRAFIVRAADPVASEKFRRVLASAGVKTVNCPFYSRGVKCADCRLCGGTSRNGRHVAIDAHAKVGLRINRLAILY